MGEFSCQDVFLVGDVYDIRLTSTLNGGIAKISSYWGIFMKAVQYECLMGLGELSRCLSWGILTGEMVQTSFYRGMFMK